MLMIFTGPYCNFENEVPKQRYYSVIKNHNFKEQLFNASLSCHKCENCHSIGIIPNPIIYDDPSFDLLVYRGYEDHELLIDEFHNLLKDCKDKNEITEDEYNFALSRKFQIIVGLDLLAYVASALENHIYCYRIVPFLNDAGDYDMFSGTILLVAKKYQEAGFPQEAYISAKKGIKFASNDANYMKEFAGYSYSFGLLREAKEALLFSFSLSEKYKHVWEKIFPSEGVLTKLHEGVNLPKLTAHVEKIYRPMNAGFYLSKTELIELGETAFNEVTKAINKLGDDAVLFFWADTIRYHIDILMGKEPNDEAVKHLIKYFPDDQREEFKKNIVSFFELEGDPDIEKTKQNLENMFEAPMNKTEENSDTERSDEIIKEIADNLTNKENLHEILSRLIAENYFIPSDKDEMRLLGDKDEMVKIFMKEKVYQDNPLNETQLLNVIEKIQNDLGFRMNFARYIFTLMMWKHLKDELDEKRRDGGF